MFFALGPIFSAILGVFTLPVIAWFFAKEDIGRVTMLQVVCSFASLLFPLGLDQAFVREFHESKKKGELLFLSIFPGFLLLIFTGLFSLLFKDGLMMLIYDQPGYFLFCITLSAVIATFLSRFFSLVLRMQERGLEYSLSQVLPKLIFALFICVLWFFSLGNSFENLALAHLLSIFVVLVLLGWSVRNDLKSMFNEQVEWKNLRGLLKFGLPLVFGGVAFWGLSVTSRLMLRSLSSYSELGLYSIGQSFAGAGAILQSIFSTVWAPTVYKWASNGENLAKINQVTEAVLALTVFAFVGCGMMSWLIPYFLPSGYESVKYFMVACLGQPLLYTLSETTVVGVSLTRKSHLAMIAPILAVLVNCFLSFLWVPVWGARGAAISTFISFFVFFIVRTECSVFVWQDIPRKKMYIFVLYILVATMITTFGNERTLSFSIGLWTLLLFGAIICFRPLMLNSYSKAKGLFKQRFLA